MKIDDTNKQLLSRREFNGLCAALGTSLPTVSATFAALSGASALAAPTGATSNGAGRTVKFRDGTIVPALGQGSAQLAQGDIRKLLRKKLCAQAFRSG